MDAEKFEQTMKMLLDEYEKSGKSMDEFIREKLAASGREDAAECAAEIGATLTEIDAKYKSLQECKKNGGNREEWLRQEVDAVAKDYSPDDTGKVLSSTVKVLDGDEQAVPDGDASYDALDAAFAIRELDDALVRNVCREFDDNGTEA